MMNWPALLITVLLSASCSDAKSVVAHFMLANAADWTNDIQQAQAVGIDAFALNFASDLGGTDAKIDDAFAAAETLSFKLFFSFDYGDVSKPFPPARVIDLVNKHASKSSYFRYNGKPLVSTFEGFQNAADWVNIKTRTGCFFMPEWASAGPQRAATEAGVADGLFSWEAWPMDSSNMTTNGDQAYKSALGGKPYMMAVSPWFYTSLPTWNKNWLAHADDLWFTRWMQVMDMQPDLVQILTWNDWGESHYIGPLSGDLSVFQYGGAPFNYAKNMPHDGWRAQLPYWISMYKNGVASVEKESATFWYRLSPKAACATGGTVGLHGASIQPGQLVDDSIFVDAILSSPAEAVVTIGQTTSTVTLGQASSANMSAIYHWSVPYGSNTGAVSIKIVRDGSTILQQTGPPISTSCESNNGLANWNAWVGMA